MFCTHCGKEIVAGSKFCGNCGKPVPLFPDSVPVQSPTAQESGGLLVQLKSVSKYKGTPSAGYSEATGTLSVYIDRLEFKKKMGSALLAGSSVIGLGLAGDLQGPPLSRLLNWSKSQNCAKANIWDCIIPWLWL